MALATALALGIPQINQARKWTVTPPPSSALSGDHCSHSIVFAERRVCSWRARKKKVTLLILSRTCGFISILMLWRPEFIINYNCCTYQMSHASRQHLFIMGPHAWSTDWSKSQLKFRPFLRLVPHELPKMSRGILNSTDLLCLYCMALPASFSSTFPILFMAMSWESHGVRSSTRPAEFNILSRTVNLSLVVTLAH